MEPLKGLLLAGGHGTRLRPLTFSGNKHMIPIANEPMIYYGLRHLADGGIREVGIILGPLHEGVEEAIQDGRAFGLNVTYIHQGDPKGLAHAVYCARDFLGESPFVMYLGDNLLQEGTRGFVEQFRREPCDAVVGVTSVPNPTSYGVVEMDGDAIVSIVEKPPVPRSDLALIGVYLFAPTIHSVVAELKPSRRGELEITDAIWNLHRSGAVVRVRKVAGWWKDTGRPEDLLEANDLILRALPSDRRSIDAQMAPDARVEGPVVVGHGSYVGHGVHIEGPAIIGTDCRIEDGARIGPGSAIGNRCVVRGAQVRRSILMEGTIMIGDVELSDSIVGRTSRLTAATGRHTSLTCVLGDSTQLRF